MQEFQIVESPEGCRLVGIDIHTATHLPLPITPEDAKALILAAFKSDDDKPRAEFHGVLADKTANGVRVHRVANDSWFEIPWTVIARDLT
ncbi:hypothetical protein [Ruegeria sp.]|uniref:hypothetical protein n=1 Tax=Ruegeria sp. TaxID=1879320 RepID=UPI003B591DEB